MPSFQRAHDFEMGKDGRVARCLICGNKGRVWKPTSYMRTHEKGSRHIENVAMFLRDPIRKEIDRQKVQAANAEKAHEKAMWDKFMRDVTESMLSMRSDSSRSTTEEPETQETTQYMQPQDTLPAGRCQYSAPSEQLIGPGKEPGPGRAHKRPRPDDEDHAGRSMQPPFAVDLVETERNVKDVPQRNENENDMQSNGANSTQIFVDELRRIWDLSPARPKLDYSDYATFVLMSPDIAAYNKGVLTIGMALMEKNPDVKQRYPNTQSEVIAKWMLRLKLSEIRTDIKAKLDESLKSNMDIFTLTAILTHNMTVRRGHWERIAFLRNVTRQWNAKSRADKEECSFWEYVDCELAGFRQVLLYLPPEKRGSQEKEFYKYILERDEALYGCSTPAVTPVPESLAELQTAMLRRPLAAGEQ